MDLFQSQNYRAVLEDWLRSQDTRGSRSQLAQAARCSPSWMTRVLNNDVQLTPDQALGLTQLLGFNEMETDYFLLLVEHERAATPALRTRIEKKLQELRQQDSLLRSSIKNVSAISEKHSTQYYSSWIYSAIHVTCMIDAFTVEELALRLQAPRSFVEYGVFALKDFGMLERVGNKWKASAQNVHLAANEMMANTFHSNWRQRTCQHLQGPGDKGLHYSAVHTVNRKDLEQIHKLLKNALVDCRAVAKASPSKLSAVLCVDWYEL